jgi:hypothetical protein
VKLAAVLALLVSFGAAAGQRGLVELAAHPAPTVVFATAGMAPFDTTSLSFRHAHTVDLSALAPPDAFAVGLSGMLIITHGLNPELCGLVAYFRPSAAFPWGAYRGQTVEAHTGGGQRSNHAIVVPMVNRTFQVWIEQQTVSGGVWPAQCAYAVNYRPDFYLVPP